ncbi:MAG: ribonuclease catalytic domain-containing protein [Burkholderiaceae bacterium]
MNYVLVEENGDLKTGTILVDNGTSLQIELSTGRRAKVKAAFVHLRFDSPAPAELLPAARELAEDIDIDFLWECAPTEEFGFAELAADYFGHEPSAAEATALLLRLQSAPVHFPRKGKGRFRPADPDTLATALAAIERRRQQELEIERLADEMLAGRLPEPIAEVAVALVVRPDKTGIAYRALDRAASAARKTPERLLSELGAFGSSQGLHRASFEFEHFPAGIGFPAVLHEADPDWEARIASLPEAAVDAFSIDDSSTIEIDDAFSVQRIDDGRVRIGIHIAAPAVGIDPGSRLDRVARERLSTVYMPGEKILMLPPSLVARFSLDSGGTVPALSLYVDLDAAGARVVDRFSRLERVRVVENLRHDMLDAVVTEAALESPGAPLPQGEALRVLWNLSNALCADREQVRGKPEPRFRTDFSFFVEDDTVRIVQRRRDAPLDRIVSELMILANSEWGRLLAGSGIAGLYRIQQAGRVRMSTQPGPHEGIGVDHYIWSTSPLRRYVDLVNQRQLLAAVAGDMAPYGNKDTELMSVLSAFEARHAAYVEFQQRMERYWCLRWLDQQDQRRHEAVTVRDDLVRLAAAPLYFRPTGLPPLPPGRRIVVDLLERDLLDLSLHGRFVDLAGQVMPDEPEADAPAVASER